MLGLKSSQHREMTMSIKFILLTHYLRHG